MPSLPVLQQSPKIRPSRTSKWRAAVLISIHLLIALHITHWLVAGRTVTPVEPSEAMAFAKAGIVNAGLIFFCVTIVLTAFFGRLFCGWACHLVALQDLARWLLQKLGLRPQPLRSRLLRWVPAAAFCYMFLWPLVYRLWIGDSFRRFETELTTAHFWATFPGWAIGALTFLVCGFVIVYLLGAKGFCAYACPYGAIFSVADRLAPMRIRVTDACHGCGHCTAVCTSNVRVHAEVRDFGMVVNDGCMKCLDCVSVCPNDALYYGFGSMRLGAKPRVARPRRRRPALSWWEEGVLAVGFTAAFLTFRGLYGVVPFLMSLGLAAVLAFLVLVAFQLVTRPHLSLRRLRLKRQGKLQPAGYAFVAVFGLLAVGWIHSAVVRGHAYLGERSYRETGALRRRALDVTQPAPSPSGSELATIRQSRSHLERVERLGLVPTPGHAPKLAWLAYLSGAPGELSQHAGNAIDRGEDIATMRQLLALEARQRGDLAGAVGELERAIALDPSRPELHVTLGLVLVESGRLEDARTVFERGQRIVPDSTLLAYNTGLASALLAEPQAAIEHFRRALDLDPDYLPARENLAGVLASVGRYEESVVHYRQATLQAPSDAETRLLLARVLVELGDLEAAAAEVAESLRLEPGRREAIILRDRISAERGAQ